MMLSMLRRLREEDQGYALVIAILLLSVMMILLVVALDAGNSALQQSTNGLGWSKTLTVAEAGLNDMVTRLGQERTAASPCPISATGDPCEGGGGEYQVGWSQTQGIITVTSVGFYPTMSSARFTRQIRAVYEPVRSFRYALFSKSALAIKNGIVVIGDVYSDGDVTVGQDATVCGSITSALGGVTLQQGADVVKSLSSSDYSCIDKSGQVWTGGSKGIVGENQVVIEGDAKASAPSSEFSSCSPALATYAIAPSTPGSQYSVNGAATACGKITGVSGYTSIQQGTGTSQPAPQTFPAYTFDTRNYGDLTCFPGGCSGGSVTYSDDAYADFNTFFANNYNDLHGTYAVWQNSPSQTTRLDLFPPNSTGTATLTLSGDFTLITNAPVNLGNTGFVTTTAAAADFTVISLYEPPSSTSCDVNGGDCSIYGLNALTFDRKIISDPDDGVVGLLYTTPGGKMAFKNQGNPGEGALYSGAMDLKNGFSVVYNARVERVLGFGTTLQQSLWQEINV